jgi:5-formyltetrahydrofolate cyclo-ligase
VTTKLQLRREIAEKRKALDARWLEIASARIVENIKTLDSFQPSKNVALYMAIAGEVDLDALFSICWKMGKLTCIPVFNAESNLYEMAEVSAKTQYRIGNYGIREPISPTPVSMAAIDLIAVPGVAFDRNGNRLGRGGGYYDHLLKGFSGFVAAVTFDFQIRPHVPFEAHDEPVDALVTEMEIVNVLNEH